MAIDSINFKNVNSVAPKKEVKEKEAPKTKEEIKDGKKKLALMATGAATVAVAGIAIAMKIKGGKSINGKTIIQASKKAQGAAQTVAQNATSELANEAKTFDDVIKLLPNPEDIKAGKGVININGATVPFKNPKGAPNIFLADVYDGFWTCNEKTPSTIDCIRYDKDSDKFIILKRFSILGKSDDTAIPISYDPKTGKKTISHPKEPRAIYVRKTVDGITTINGKEKAKRTIETLKDGTKKISVDYYDGNPKPFCRKVITIAPDGKKTREMLAKI